MLARIVGGICLIVADWYAVGWCFEGLTYPSDITCLVGTFGLLLLGYLNYKIARRLFN